MVAVLTFGFAAGMPLAAQDVAGGDSARPIALAEAVRLAQRNAPIAVQARGQTRTARMAERRAFGSFLPSLSVNASSSRREGSQFNTSGAIVPWSGTPWSFSNGLSANVDLFDGGRRLFDLREARASSDAANANEVTQRFRVALDVKQQYYASLAALESEVAARAQLEQAEAQMRASVSRMRAGAATKSDSLRSVIQVGNARLALLTAQNSRRVADAALTRLVGSTFPVTAVPTDTLDSPVALDSVDLIRLADAGPVVQQAEANVAAARAARRGAFSPYLPTISASYNRSGSASDDEFRFAAEQYAYMNNLQLRLTYPLFDGFQRESERTRTQVAENNAEASLRDARLQARQTLVQQLGALRTAEARVSIQTLSVAAAEEDLRVQQQRYALGSSTLLDVLTSQSQLNQARAALIAARHDYRIARAQLEALVGREL